MKKIFLTLSLVFLMTISGQSTLHAESMELNLDESLLGINLEGAVVIIHLNDSHGRIDHTDEQIGFARVSGLRNAFLELGAEVLLLDAGDTLHGAPAATLSQGMDIVDLMNAMGVDVFTIGNHDFNYGFTRLLYLTDAMNFPTLVSNIVTRDTGEAVFDGHMIIEKAGKTFGIFGVLDQFTPTNPRNIETIRITNHIEAAQKQVGLLQEKDVDYIIGIAHIGIEVNNPNNSITLLSEVDGIDVLIDGHSHVAFVAGMPVRGDINFTPHETALMASTSGYMQDLGVIVITADGEIISTLLTTENNIPFDEQIKATIDEIMAAQYIILSEVVAYTEVFLDGTRNALRTGETNLGNLITDAMRAASGADIAFTHAGSIREPLDAGPITLGDILTVLPFGNYVVVKEIPGETIIAMLEHSMASYPAETGFFAQVSGIAFAFDPEADVGNRIVSVKVNEQPIDLTATYLVAVNNNMAQGGAGYAMLPNYRVVGMENQIDELLLAHMKDNPETSKMEIEGRIISVPGGQTAVGHLEITTPQERPHITETLNTGTVVNAWFLNVRNRGSSRAEIIGVLSAGDTVRILETTAWNWHRIETDHISGWVYGGFIKLN